MKGNGGTRKVRGTENKLAPGELFRNDNMNISYRTIHTNGIVKESEKALCIRCVVRWSATNYTRDFWIPKSLVRSVYAEGKLADIANFILNKMEVANTFKGYQMWFDEPFEPVDPDFWKKHIKD